MAKKMPASNGSAKPCYHQSSSEKTLMKFLRENESILQQIPPPNLHVMMGIVATIFRETWKITADTALQWLKSICFTEKSLICIKFIFISANYICISHVQLITSATSTRTSRSSEYTNVERVQDPSLLLCSQKFPEAHHNDIFCRRRLR